MNKILLLRLLGVIIGGFLLSYLNEFHPLLGQIMLWFFAGIGIGEIVTIFIKE